VLHVSKVYEFELPPRETIAYYYALSTLGIGVSKKAIILESLDPKLEKVKITDIDAVKLGKSLLEFFISIGQKRKQPTEQESPEILAYRALTRNTKRIPLQRLNRELVEIGVESGLKGFVDKYPNIVKTTDYASIAISFIIDLLNANIDYMGRYIDNPFPTAFRSFHFGKTRGYKSIDVKNLKITIFGFGLAVTGSFISMLGAYEPRDRRERVRYEHYALPDGSPSSLLNSGLVYELYHELNSYGEEVWQVIENFLKLNGVSADLATQTAITAYLLDVFDKHPCKSEIFNSFLLVRMDTSENRPNVVWVSPFPSMLVKWDLNRKILRELYKAIRRAHILIDQINRLKKFEEALNTLNECKDALSTCVNSMAEYAWTNVKDYKYMCIRVLNSCVEMTERRLQQLLNVKDFATSVQDLINSIRHVISIIGRINHSE